MIVYRELSSVEADLDFSAKALYSLTNDIEKHYRRVEIPKHDGTFRTLYVPDILLKTVQRRIANRILSLEPISRYATAYKKGSFIRKNAVYHVGKETVLKLDIKHFFDSILYSHVKEKVFRAERFSEPIRVLLTMLCYYKDRLPQGAPTSPVITNIVMRDFDETVGDWCNQRGITYTRYCDDMTFSGSFDVNEVKTFVKSELRKMGFFLNEKKTVAAKGTQRQIVTGIVVNKKLNVSSEYRKKLRQEVYYCRKYGVEEHLKRIGNSVDPKKYLQSLLGRISYVLEVRCDDKAFLADKEFIVGLIKQYE